MLQRKPRSRAINVLAGARAKSEGKLFEDLFLRACIRTKIKATRMPDGCKQIGPSRLIRVPTPFDWILSFNGRAAMIDTKSTSSPFPNSHIEPHQVLDLFEHEQHGSMAGYVIWLREENQVIFTHASMLNSRIGTRGSISTQTPGVIPLGPIGSMDPTQIFARRDLARWMQKEIADGPKDS